MTLIFLNRFFYPDHSATSQLLSDLAFALAAQELKVSVITSRLRYTETADTLPAQETVKGVNVHRIWTSRFGRANLIGRAIDYATFYLAAAWCLWRIARSGDVVIAKTDPPMLSVIAVPVCWLRDARLVNWMQDIFPEVAVSLDVARGRLWRCLVAIMQALRDWSVRRSDVNVVLGQRMAEHVRGLRVRNDRICIIPNWADGAQIRSIDHADNPLRKSWGLDGSFVVGYSGNLGRAHDYNTMLDAAEWIERSHADLIESQQSASPQMIIWLFIGGGALYAQLRQEVERRSLTSVRFESYQPREQLAESLSVADVHLVSMRPEMEGLIVPSKFYGVAAVGRPTLFIGDPNGEIPTILSSSKCGLTVQPGDGEALARHIVELSHDRERCQLMGRHARTLLERHFDKEIAIAKWGKLLRELQTRPVCD